jgi:hypothetical protein
MDKLQNNEHVNTCCKSSNDTVERTMPAPLAIPTTRAPFLPTLQPRSLGYLSVVIILRAAGAKLARCIVSLTLATLSSIACESIDGYAITSACMLDEVVHTSYAEMFFH